MIIECDMYQYVYAVNGDMFLSDVQIYQQLKDAHTSSRVLPFVCLNYTSILKKLFI